MNAVACNNCCMGLAGAMTNLAGYTADQWGLVTTAQANMAGVDNSTLHRLVAEGLLDRVTRGVYASASATEDPLRRHRAAWLLLNPATPAWERTPLEPNGGVISHRSAATVLGVGDLAEDRIELTVPSRRTTRHTDVKLRIRALDTQDVTDVGGLPVTTIERTVDDLLADGVDGGHVGDVVAHALRRGMTTGERLVPRLGRHGKSLGIRSRDGEHVLQHLLDQATNPDISSLPVQGLTRYQREALLRRMQKELRPAVTLPPGFVDEVQAIAAQHAEAAALIRDLITRDFAPLQEAMWKQIAEQVRPMTEAVNAQFLRDAASLYEAMKDLTAGQHALGEASAAQATGFVQEAGRPQAIEAPPSATEAKDGRPTGGTRAKEGVSSRGTRAKKKRSTTDTPRPGSRGTPG
ncbi:type IV toxin-antitoxin system AbiEi family antitoxin domain-containing protein [Actinosynnema sp. CA-248983]